MKVFLIFFAAQLAMLYFFACAQDTLRSQDHRYAETVLYSRFVALTNTWSFEHPKGEDHYFKFDAKDSERLEQANKAWVEFYKTMKRAGY